MWLAGNIPAVGILGNKFCLRREEVPILPLVIPGFVKLTFFARRMCNGLFVTNMYLRVVVPPG